MNIQHNIIQRELARLLKQLARDRRRRRTFIKFLIEHNVYNEWWYEAINYNIERFFEDSLPVFFNYISTFQWDESTTKKITEWSALHGKWLDFCMRNRLKERTRTTS